MKIRVIPKLLLACTSQVSLPPSTRKKRKEGGGANISNLKVLLEWTGNVHFCTVGKITFLVGGACKPNVVLEKFLKNWL